jgi:hypothetical protein
MRHNVAKQIVHLVLNNNHSLANIQLKITCLVLINNHSFTRHDMADKSANFV